MKKINYLAGVALLVTALSQQAQADVVVDTGTPTATSMANTLYYDGAFGGQWLAAEFSNSQSWNISDIKGYILADWNNPDNATFTVSVYNNGTNNLPDISSINSPLYSTQANFSGDGWNDVSGLAWNLDPGTYWVAFEVHANDSLVGLMPGKAPNPMLKNAAYDGGVNLTGYQAATGVNSNIGVQISSVPVPASVWLFASGLLALGRFGKRKAT